MITPDRPFWLKRWPKWSPRRPAWWAVGLTVLALVGVVLWWSARPEGPVGPHEGAAAVGQGTPAYQGGVFGPGGQAPALAVPSVLPDGRPSDFSPQEWTALKDAMSKTAKPEAELQRVVAYLRFQKAFGAWQGLRESSDTARRQQLASQLVAQIPERLRQGEVTLGEALVLEAALWTDLEPDEARRKVRLEEVQGVLASAAPQPRVRKREPVRDFVKDIRKLGIAGERILSGNVELLLQGSSRSADTVATAVNGEFVARGARADHALHDGDAVLCFSPITGG